MYEKMRYCLSHRTAGLRGEGVLRAPGAAGACGGRRMAGTPSGHCHRTHGMAISVDVDNCTRIFSGFARLFLVGWQAPAIIQRLDWVFTYAGGGRLPAEQFRARR